MEYLYEERAVDLCVDRIYNCWYGGYSSHGIDFYMISAIFSLGADEFVQRVCNRYREKHGDVPFGLDLK